MNFLVHLYLSPPGPEGILGTMMGDFVKGRLAPTVTPGLRSGIERHRQVDSFSQHHPATRRSRSRFDPSFGHTRPVMVDIFYDHFMARDWRHHTGAPLETFAARIYSLLESNLASLPPGLREVAPRMIAHDWLVSYREVEVIGHVLQRTAARLRRPTRLAEGLSELRRNYRELQNDFEEFLAAAAERFPRE